MLLLTPLLGLAYLLLPAAEASGAARASQTQPRPNIVLVETDDQTADSLRFMYHTRRLVGREGATFTRSFASFPLCCPSRATLWTGQYAHNHGVIHNRPPLGGYVKLDKSSWLPLWLQGAGYHTIHLGRTLNGYGQDNLDLTEVPPGFDEWYVPLDPSTFDYYDFTLNENHVLITYPRRREPAQHQTEAYNRMAASLIERSAPAEQPFFLYVGYSAPHSGAPREADDPPDVPTPAVAARHRNVFAAEPLPTPRNFNEADVSDKPQEVADLPPLSPQQIAGIRESYQQRLESLLAVDEGVKGIYEALARTGELDDTLIVLTSDNGFFHGEHRVSFGKGLPYEPAVRVPLVMRGPGVPRRRLHQLVSNIDLAPTILDAAGVQAGRVQDGRSLFKLLRDPGREWGRDLLIENGRGANGTGAFAAIRTYRYLYVEHYASGELELYDLSRDPDELRSLDEKPRYDGLRRELARRLQRLRRCRGQGCRLAPRLGLALGGATRRARRGRCIPGDLPVRMSGRDRRRLVRTDFMVGRRRVARRTRAPFVGTIPRERLRRGRRVTVRVRAVLRDGRVVTLDRRVVGCR